MAAFLNNQLDFIFFFYGLAFILLGGTCWIATARGAGKSWAILGGFGLLHGSSEWLDLTALILGDSPTFAVARLAVMTISFLLLMDFARLEGIQLGLRLPGRWIYVLLGLLIMLLTVADGPGSAGIVARYAICFVGAFGAGAVLAWQNWRSSPGARKFALSAAAGFILYAFAAGLIVPAGHVWPSTIINYDAFTELTAMPVQLVRGLLACWISFSIWAIWSHRAASEIASPQYTSFVHEQFTWVLVVMGAILVSGWMLTEYLGGIYRENVEREARADIDLLSSRLAGDTATVEATVQTLAGSPSILPLLIGGNQKDKALARSVLELNIEASGAERGYILDRGGAVVASSSRRDTLPGAAGYGSTPAFQSSMGGKPTYQFACDVRVKLCSYSVSYPIQADDGAVAGVAVLTKSLESFESDLREFDRPYFFIDPDGVVMMTNRPEVLYRTLWPLPESRKSAIAKRFRHPDDLQALEQGPMLGHRIVDASWIKVQGERSFVRRTFVDHSDWSLVILKPPRQIFATRFLGIVITLLVTIMALIYLLGKARRIRDEVERDNRLHLQELADDLGAKATTDPLTGLQNRLKLETTLIDEMRRSVRYDTPLTMIIFDIDHFKEINDTYGHSVGDSVLVQLARLVSSNVRSSDLLVRWGGEEFLILMPGVGEAEGYQAAQKLCDTIAKLEFEHVGTVTCSFGVTQHVPGETTVSLINRADEALYQAKACGRNQVKLAHAQPSKKDARAQSGRKLSLVGARMPS